MPIYEFFCRPCNTIFSFYSSRINTTKVPSCPKCGKKLQRQMSIFTTIGRAREEDGLILSDMDENRLESVLGELAQEAENVNEEDPRQMAKIMRRFSEKTGLHLGDSMEEAIARLEAGEDPDKIEEEMGELFEGEDPLAMMKKKVKVSKSPAPFRDEVLYQL